jgi:integral membrane sensor domain MASE1
MKPQGPVILLCLIVAGAALAYLSERLLPLGYGVAVLWLGAVVIANGSIWFGGWGVVAGIIFPFLAGWLEGADPQLVALAILPNLIEGIVPAAAFRLLGADPALQDRRSLIVYALFGVIGPSLAGGVLGSCLWLLTGRIDERTFQLLALDWSLSNIAVLIVFGFPAAYLLSPAFRERGWLVSGWWR